MVQSGNTVRLKYYMTFFFLLNFGCYLMVNNDKYFT